VIYGFDTETALIEEAKLAPELACLTYSDGERSDIIHHADPALPRVVEWLLTEETTTANGAYDCAVLWAHIPDLRDLIWEAIGAGRIHDVLIRQKLLDLGQGTYQRVYRRLPGEDKTTLLRYSLSDVHARYYGVRMEKDEWRLRYGELRQYPLHQWPPGSVRYATGDPEATVRIHHLQDVEAQNNPLHNLWDEVPQVRAAWALHLMSCWGFYTDLKRVTEVIEDIEAEMPDLAKALIAEDLIRWDGGENRYKRREKNAKVRMYAAVGDAGELTDTGYKKVLAGAMTKDEALRAGYIKIDEEWCESSNDPALVNYFQFRQNQLLLAKLRSIRRAAKGGARGTLPVQTQFEVLKETGRTSSSENKLIENSMALQNPPRKGGFRSCFRARPGCTLIAADYGQAELVSLAQVTYSAFGFSKMRDLINAGMDLHVDFGKEIMAIEQNRKILYEDAWALHKAKDALMKERRTLAKAFNFGKPGGLGAASFQSYARKAWGVEITFAQSKNLGYAWLNHFPEMREYFAWISRLLEEGGGSTNIQQYMSKRWRGKCRYTQACNSPFQGLTADAAKAACFEVARHCYTVKSSDLYGCRPILFVHDEILTEAPKEQADAAAKEQERIMVEVYQRYTPDVLITADAHLMDSWFKEAEAVYDERGKLMPWSPPEIDDEKFEEPGVAWMH